MKRRDFLKGLAALGGTALVPIAVANPQLRRVLEKERPTAKTVHDWELVLLDEYDSELLTKQFKAHVKKIADGFDNPIGHQVWPVEDVWIPQEDHKHKKGAQCYRMIVRPVGMADLYPDGGVDVWSQGNFSTLDWRPVDLGIGDITITWPSAEPIANIT